MSLLDLAERGVLPDWLIRIGIRRLLAKRIRQETREDVAEQEVALREFTRQLRQSPIAIDTDAANVQHYEVPTTFFQQVLGPRLKYSCYLFFMACAELFAHREAKEWFVAHYLFSKRQLEQE